MVVGSGGGGGGGCKGGVAMRASASHQSGQTSNPGCALNIMWVEFCWWFLSLLPDAFFHIHFQPVLSTFNLIRNRRHRTMLLTATTKLLPLNTFFCSFLFPWSVNVTLDPQTCLFSKWREFRIILFLKKIVSIKCRVFIKTQHLLECYKFELQMKLEYANTIKNILQYLTIPFLIC